MHLKPSSAAAVHSIFLINWNSAASTLLLGVLWTPAVGAVMGFGLVYGGVDSIVWNQTTVSAEAKLLTRLVI